MSSDDEDVFVCEQCDDIFLSKSALQSHVSEAHESPPKSKEDDSEKPKRRMGPASQVKRERSSSSEGNNDVQPVVKKIKMGPRSRVKRDRSSSDENSRETTPLFNNELKTQSSDDLSLESNIDKIVDGLASTEDETEVKKENNELTNNSKEGSIDRKKLKKKKKHKDRDREKDRDKEKYRDKEKDKDRLKDRDKEKSRDNEKEKKRDRDKHKDRHRDEDVKKKNKVKRIDPGELRNYGKDNIKNGNLGHKENPSSHKPQVRSRYNSSSDDEETNRRKAEEAKAKWQKKEDEVKGKVAKLSRTDSVDSNKFIASDDEEISKKIKDDRKISLSDLVPAKSKVDSPAKPKIDKKAGFAHQGTVAAHDNVDGPECPKCGQVCKDNSNLKNHVLSHYYQVFYDVLPDCKPFSCPLCGNPSRDRITMVRHYAFTHKKLFEMTDITPEDIAGFGNRASRTPSVKKKEKKLNDMDNDSDDSTKSMKERITAYSNQNMERPKEKHRENDEKRHKEHKKKHKKDKKHKHQKEKKHKKEKHKNKDKDRDRDRDVANPLSSLFKEMTPDSSSSEPVKARTVGNVVGDGEDRDECTYTSTLAPMKRIAHVPHASDSPLQNNVPTDVDNKPKENDREDEQNIDEESDDELGDLPIPVFAD